MIRFCLAASIFLYGGTVQAGQMTHEQCADVSAALLEFSDANTQNYLLITQLRVLNLNHYMGSCDPSCLAYVSRIAKLHDDLRLIDFSVIEKGQAALNIACQEFLSK